LIQGWSSIFPKFTAVDFVSLYIEIPVMLVMYFGWLVARRISSRSSDGLLDHSALALERFTDLVDIDGIDLRRDEYDEQSDDHEEETTRNKRLNRGKMWILWKLYYSIV